MSQIPAEMKYLASHEWLRLEKDGTATVGITDHAQDALGDVVYVDLPDVGAEVQANDDIAVVESVKAASDIYTPVSGTVIEINENLTDAPGLVNNDPYGDGWFFRIKLSDPAELNELLNAEDYAEICAEEKEA